VKQVGRELGVRYILEGSVRRGGNRLRITAQLVEAASGTHVWAERFDREIADLFAVQDEITERVVAAIEPELYAAEDIRSQRKPPNSLDAWECVIRALSCIGQGTRAGDTDAEVFCRRAIAIAPRYGQARSLLAWTLLRSTFWAGQLMAILPETTHEVRTALDLDDRDPWAHLAQAVLFTRMRRFNESVRAFRRALELNPNFALAHAFIGIPLNHQGANEEALSSAQRALRLSPSDRLVGAYASRAMAGAHFISRRYADCIAWARNNIEKTPDDPVGHMFLAAALALLGDLDAAAEARATLMRLRPDYSVALQFQNGVAVGEVAERLNEGLRRAGVPEQ
jgi:tetratricopeptide (TPR) repeat protein